MRADFYSNQSQRGVALVITLIMLSVITFLTVAFLAVSSRDRASVTTSLNQTDSHLMADTALQRFQTELTTRMMDQGTLQAYDLMQTRNFINTNGFDSTITTNNTNNVNYEFRSIDGQPLNNDDRIRNIGNLFFDPRPPVFIRTNSDNTLPLDFRFYLDYNRNRRFESNGIAPVVIDEVGSTNGAFANFLGEAEWIGVLQNPEYPHSPTNRFIGRYLYLALPVSRTLDLNYIHNYAKGNIGMPSQVTLGNGDGFLRNQGYGSYEINLAAFLRDLNTNMYPNQPTILYSYEYLNNVAAGEGATANRGMAFNDAVSFLSYRYSGNLFNLSNVAGLFPGNGTTAFSGATAFGRDFIDGYSTRPILVAPFLNTTDPDFSPRNLTGDPWAGSRNPKQFFEPQELFDPAKTSAHFVNELNRVSARLNSYDRYTFTRLLEQMGTGSEPELRGKININYVNDPAANTVATNFANWTPYQFFTNVSERLIKDNWKTHVVSPGETNYYLFNTNDIANQVRENFSVTNIQIYPTNEYTAPLHRLLQVAANVYDATTSNKYPTIYRPQFEGSLAAAYITNYVVETNSQFLADAMTNAVQDRTNITVANGLVWGVPVVVAAKKGFPNFNEFLLHTSVQVARNIQVIKRDTNATPTFLQTNQMLVLGISNTIALEAWNSYIQPYTNKFRFIVTNILTMSLTNELGNVIWGPSNFGSSTKMQSNTWPSVLVGSNAFILPISTNSTFLTNSTFRVGVFPPFVPSTTNFQKGAGYPTPTWGLQITNRLIYALIDTVPSLGRVVDFVNLDGMTANIDITKELLGPELNTLPGIGDEPGIISRLWKSNRLDGSGNIMIPTEGIRNQILVSMGLPFLTDEYWRSYGAQAFPANKEKAISEFSKFMGITPTISGYQNIPMPAYTNAQTPFNPVRKMDQIIAWQVNDPLVHYMARDLRDATNLSAVIPRIPPNGPVIVPTNLQKINERYRPWGRRYGGGDIGPTKMGSEIDEDFAYDLRVKDPRVRWSDDWDFPTNKFPSIGELGRVHRGTPWQTIYFKAATITNRLGAADNRTSEQIGRNWHEWAGHIETHSTNDWNLLDVFSAAPNDNAARGLLSVNQTNEAAWSAVLSGVVVITNRLNDAQAKASEAFVGETNAFASLVIPPGIGISNIVKEINAVRATRPNGVFNTLGEILAVPSLSVFYSEANNFIDSSPYLNVTNYNYVGTNKVVETESNGKPKNQNKRFYGVTDEAYERIPRQIASLLKLGEPRFVVYSYGQSLKPAPNSIVMNAPAGSGLFNLCTNYQITGEVLTRTILRVIPNPDAQHPKTVIESYNIMPAE